MKIAAGLLMYYKDKVFLTHMGGPFHKNRDTWYIPAGRQEDGEDLLTTAKREFEEETGIKILDTARMTDLGSVKYNGKQLHVWAFEQDLPPNYVYTCNLTPFGWPENDKGEFFELEKAKLKIAPPQLPILIRLQQIFQNTT